MAVLTSFAAALSQLEGRYITAEDVGTSPTDMEVVSRHTPYVGGLVRKDGAFGGDPSPYTAYGVFLGILEA